MSLSEDIAFEAALRQKLAEVQGKIKRETAAINKTAAPWDPARDRDALAAAQARADSVAAAFGSSAPAPMLGEEVIDYRIRLANPYKQFSKDKKLQNLDLAALADASPQAFSNIESMIYTDAAAYAQAPASVPQCTLREIKKRDQSGRQITEFFGDPMSWMRPFMSHPMRVTRIKTPGWEAEALRQAARAVR